MKILALILCLSLIACAPRVLQGRVFILTVTKVEYEWVKVEDGQGLVIWLMKGRDIPHTVKEGEHYKYIMMR